MIISELYDDLSRPFKIANTVLHPAISLPPLQDLNNQLFGFFGFGWYFDWLPHFSRLTKEPL
jgi:hypothetical protein